MIGANQVLVDHAEGTYLAALGAALIAVGFGYQRLVREQTGPALGPRMAAALRPVLAPQADDLRTFLAFEDGARAGRQATALAAWQGSQRVRSALMG